jgi:hypothetical protein
MSGYGKISQQPIVTIDRAREYVERSREIWIDVDMADHVKQCDAWLRHYDTIQGIAQCKVCFGRGRITTRGYDSGPDDDVPREVYNEGDCYKCHGHGVSFGKR